MKRNTLQVSKRTDFVGEAPGTGVAWYQGFYVLLRLDWWRTSLICELSFCESTPGRQIGSLGGLATSMVMEHIRNPQPDGQDLVKEDYDSPHYPAPTTTNPGESISIRRFIDWEILITPIHQPKVSIDFMTLPKAMSFFSIWFKMVTQILSIIKRGLPDVYSTPRTTMAEVWTLTRTLQLRSGKKQKRSDWFFNPLDERSSTRWTNSNASNFSTHDSRLRGARSG